MLPITAHLRNVAGLVVMGTFCFYQTLVVK